MTLDTRTFIERAVVSKIECNLTDVGTYYGNRTHILGSTHVTAAGAWTDTTFVGSPDDWHVGDIIEISIRKITEP